MSFGEFYGALAGLGESYQAGLDQFELKKNQRDAAKIYGDQLSGLSGGAVAPTGALSALGAPVAPIAATAPLDKTLPTFAQGSDIGRYAGAIKVNESGGRYEIVGPTHPKYGRALGAYQVMESNLPSWSREALGREVTPDEFLKSPQIQDAIFQKKFGQAVEKYGNPQDAASVWFTGRPLAQGAKSRDSLGTTGQSYVDKFTASLGRAPAGTAPGLPATVAQMPGSGVPAPVQMASRTGGTTPTLAGQPAPAELGVDSNILNTAPRQVAMTPAGAADMPAPDAVPAEYRIPSAQPAPATSDFTPGTVASPALGGGNAALPAPAPAGPRVTPQQADQLRRMLANPVTAPAAQAMIQKLSGPEEWETKEIGGRVVQVNKAGNIRAVPGFEKPPSLKQFKGSDGNDYLLNESTGALTRAVEGKEKAFKDLVNPADRSAAGIPANYAGPVQRGPNNELRFPGAGQNGITNEQKIQNAGETKLAEAKVADVVSAIEAAKPAGERLGTLAILADAWKNGDGKITTGPLGESALKLKQFAKGSLGIDTNGLTETELVQKVGTQLAAQASKDLTSRPTQFDFQVFLANNPGINLSPQGNLSLINLMQQKAKHDLQLAQLARKQKNGDDWDQVVADFDKAHPIISPLTKRPLDPQEVIFPADRPAAGGAPGQSGQPGQPSATARQPAPASMLNDARDAIRRGAPKAAVIQEMISQGYVPSGL